MALTKIKLDSMVTGTLPDANIPDDITITGLIGQMKWKKLGLNSKKVQV